MPRKESTLVAQKLPESSLMCCQPWFETSTTLLVHSVCVSLWSKFFIPSKYHLMPTIITKQPHLPLGRLVSFILGQLEGSSTSRFIPTSEKLSPTFPSPLVN